MGSSFTKIGRQGYVSGKHDTAILVQSEIQHLPSTCEEISLDVSSLAATNAVGLKFGQDLSNLDCLSECTTLSTLSGRTPTPLDQKHRYHLFFAYHEDNLSWVENIVRVLEAEPYSFKCCYAQRDFDVKSTSVQNILCSAMLSQHTVVVLTPGFVEDVWADFEEGLSHLTTVTLPRQRVIPMLLEECKLPDSLRMLPMIDARPQDFLETLFRSVCNDGLCYSDSMNTIRSFTQSQGFQNAQLLTRISATVEGFCNSRLVFDYEEVPDPLVSRDINFSRQEYSELVRVVGQEGVGQHLSWLVTAVPTIILASVFGLWCLAFILVIVFFPDNASSTLPVRLCVFVLPAIFIVFGCVFRWRKVKEYKEKFSITMFSQCIQVNQFLYLKSKPVIVSSSRSHDDIFHIYFMYYNTTPCLERIKMFLSHCTDEDIVKLSKLIDVYTQRPGYLDGRPLASRLGTMMAAAYSIQMTYRRLPQALEQRHTRRRHCLCQFVEEFLAAYLPCLRSEADTAVIKLLFLRYLNCQLEPVPPLLRTLGINIVTS